MGIIRGQGANQILNTTDSLSRAHTALCEAYGMLEAGVAERASGSELEQLVGFCEGLLALLVLIRDKQLESLTSESLSQSLNDRE